MNDYLQNTTQNQFEPVRKIVDLESSGCISLNYLKSINAFPNTSDTTSITGQLLSSILLSHIDLENKMFGSEKTTNLSSFSCEFHPQTFHILFWKGLLGEKITIEDVEAIDLQSFSVVL